MGWGVQPISVSDRSFSVRWLVEPENVSPSAFVTETRARSAGVERRGRAGLALGPPGTVGPAPGPTENEGGFIVFSVFEVCSSIALLCRTKIKSSKVS